MGNCKDCRFWQEIVNPSRSSVAPHEQSNGRRYCELITDGGQRFRLAVFVPGGDDYDDYGLWVAPDFGCVLFEPKPDTADMDDS
jgi:hypothetical protein